MLFTKRQILISLILMGVDYFMLKKILVLSVSILAISAFAEEEKSAWSGNSELGFVKTSGNSNTEALIAKQSIVYDARPWRNTIKLEATNAKSEVDDDDPATTEVVETKDKRTTEKYYASEQLDRFISERLYAFLKATYEKDRFSGFDNQVTGLLGLGYTLVDTESFDMKMELGAGTSRDKYEECNLKKVTAPDTCDTKFPDADKTESSVLYYLSEELAWKFSEPAELGQNLSIEETDDNRKSRFSIFVKSQMMASVAMKITYSFKHTDEVPAGQKHKDEELTASLVYSF